MKNKQINLIQHKYEIVEDSNYSGAFVLSSDKKVIKRIRFIHKKSDIKSRVHLKFILLDEVKLDISATIKVESKARGIDTYLRLDVLILSDKARAKIVPNMEIHENDVSAGHGCTIGQVDKTQMLYLQSRGLGKLGSIKLLAKAFLGDISEANLNKDMIKKIDKINF